MKRILFVAALAFATASCQPAGIIITACEQDGELAFALADIDDVFSSYPPRPDRVWVAKDKGEAAESPRLEAVWTATLPESVGEPLPMKLVRYGQVPEGWETEVPASELEPGVQYDVLIDDGEHSGGVLFRYGDPLPVCEPI